MRRTTRLLLLTAVAGFLLPVAASQSASAVDQDLVVSATSGEPGEEVEITSASCDTSNTGNTFRYLYARLLAGTAPDQVLAGTGFGIDGDTARIVLPDWTTPGAATIEAFCVEVDFDLGEEEVEPTVNRFAYDPVAFDLLAGSGTPVQTRTYSRTSLQAGQAFSVQASGCFLDNADYAYVDVMQGDDLSFTEFGEIAFSGEGEMDGDAFEALTAMSNGTIDVNLTGAGESVDDVVVEEIPTNVPAGTYSTVAYCQAEDGATLLFEPQTIEVTGNAPFGDIDLTTSATTPTANLAGGSCTAGDVSAMWFADDLTEAFYDPTAPDRSKTAGARVSPAGFVAGHRGTASLVGTGSRDRLLTSDSVDAVAAPGADGSWSLVDQVAYDQALVGAFAACGDPLGDGFIYDPQAAVLSVEEVTTTTAVPTTVPVPVPANAVPGTPTYAG